MNISDYKYKYEMHLHTSEASKCAVSTGPEMVRAHKAAGYSGIYITNHAWGGNTCIDRHLPYREWVKQFAKGYYDALEEGDKVELDVFFGWEAGFNGTEFLIYGLSPEWMMNHPDLWDASIEKQHDLVREGGGMVMHAHPFREEWYIDEIRLFPEYVDGVEIANATHSSPLSKAHNNPEFDKRAAEYARRYNFPTVGGSDVHSTNVLHGGTLFSRRMKSPSDFVSTILGREEYLLCDGVSILNMKGELCQ